LLTGFKSVFNKHVTLVLPTGGSEAVQKWARNKARFDAEQLWYIGNGSIDVITDKEFVSNGKLFDGRNLLVYGDNGSNLAAAKIFGIDQGTIASSSNNAVVFTTKISDGRVVARIYGTKDSVCPYGDRVPLFRGGAGIPDYMILDKSFLTEGIKAVQAGFWFDKNK
jgi:hypothetical protein